MVEPIGHLVQYQFRSFTNEGQKIRSLRIIGSETGYRDGEASKHCVRNCLVAEIIEQQKLTSLHGLKEVC